MSLLRRVQSADVHLVDGPCGELKLELLLFGLHNFLHRPRLSGAVLQSALLILLSNMRMNYRSRAKVTSRLELLSPTQLFWLVDLGLRNIL